MWIHLPPSCPSVPASEDSTLPSDEFFQMLSTSVMWRSKPLPPRSWQRVWKTVPWVRRQFGAISRRFSLDAGAVTLTSSPLVFPVSPSPSPGVDSGTKTPATSGRTSAGLSTGRDRVSSFSKTYQDCSLFDSPTDDRPTPWSENSWNDWATQLRAVSLQRRKLAHLTSVNGCSSSVWQTPKVATGKYSYPNGDNTKPFDNLEGQAEKFWPTPRNSDQFGPGTHGDGGMDLRTTVALWPTARAEDSESCGNHPGAVDSLTGAAKLWATPSSRDFKDSDGMATTGMNPDGTERTRLDQLPRQAFQFGLPAPQTPPLGPTSSVDTTTSPRPSKRRLNPRFVEWLMGWPLGWTAFAPVAMASSPPKPPTPSDSCLQGKDTE